MGKNEKKISLDSYPGAVEVWKCGQIRLKTRHFSRHFASNKNIVDMGHNLLTS